ncbi:GspH/FimT family pseudopilin [Photobacterium lucens]|uniref:GspH/FimT family pseudopilin n=1 Tax=Photobacterium lucens TaxID=2562949 RepID=UPI00136A107C|nr:prepilin-type N-terminal cleavage/methylation domain-containing protein [Photobacterium lucens]MBP2701952.1 prepilin-type N-terminal cleavage/methylation domain-containing protein [Vibrio parahaemolyticus]MZG58460.1 prepilin-type N-terminal cleavage/methylation domain-containing protein [Photobacterium lucens]MZG79222.1 prepilin-type N-terminal cleavage/methylation domain-containing protein [Photobacterium lucens]
MARGNSSYFHYIHFIAKRQRGFTLLELVIAVSVMSIMLAMAAPSFSNLIASQKIKRLATELEWIMVQAKSEAVMRGANTKLHYISVNTTPSSINNWSIVLKDNTGNQLSSISSDSFSNIKICRTFTSNDTEFKSRDGRPKTSGGIVFYVDAAKKVKVITSHLTGRIYACSIGLDSYGFKACASSGVSSCV